MKQKRSQQKILLDWFKADTIQVIAMESPPIYTQIKQAEILQDSIICGEQGTQSKSGQETRKSWRSWEGNSPIGHNKQEWSATVKI